MLSYSMPVYSSYEKRSWSAGRFSVEAPRVLGLYLYPLRRATGVWSILFMTSSAAEASSSMTAMAVTVNGLPNISFVFL